MKHLLTNYKKSYRIIELVQTSPLISADEIVVHCHHGMRSLQATRLLRGMGFKKSKSLAGGIDAWADKYDQDMPRY